MSRIAWMLFAIVALTPSIVAAAPIEGLQRVSVAVADRTDAARSEAMQAALSRVLVRLTGDPAVAESEGARPLIEEAERFVQEYGYQDDGAGLKLGIRFDGQTLREALVRAGIRIWQPDRPPVLVWLAASDGGRRSLVGSDEAVELRRALTEAATDVGVPLLFPLLDLEDQRRVSFTDVAGGFSEPVLEASRRYETPLVLIGRLRSSGAGWFGRWALYDGAAGASWEVPTQSLPAALEATADSLAQRLRSDYAALPDINPTAGLSVSLTDIDTLARYAEAQRLLAGLPGVAAARLQRLDGDTGRFLLVTDVSAQRVRQALSRSPRLQPIDAGGRQRNAHGESTGVVNSDATYRLAR